MTNREHTDHFKVCVVCCARSSVLMGSGLALSVQLELDYQKHWLHSLPSVLFLVVTTSVSIPNWLVSYVMSCVMDPCVWQWLKVKPG